MKTRLFLPLLAGVVLALGTAFAANAPATTITKTNGTLTAAGDGTVNVQATDGTVKVTATGSIWADSAAVVKFTADDEKVVKKEATKMDKVDGFTYTLFTGEVNISLAPPADPIVAVADAPATAVKAEGAKKAQAPTIRVFVDGTKISVTAAGIGKVMLVGTGTYTTKNEGAKKPKAGTWFVKPAEVAPAIAPGAEAAPVVKDGATTTKTVKKDTKPATAPWVNYGKIVTPKTPKPATTTPVADVPAAA